MAVTAFWYGLGLKAAFNKEVDWVDDTVRVMLVENTYTPDQDAHDYIDDVRADEASGTGYTEDGAEIGSRTLTYTGATNILKLDGADTSWASSEITARYAVIYVDTGTDSTSPLLGYVDFGEDVTSSGGTFLITWSGDGILKITAS